MFSHFCSLLQELTRYQERLDEKCSADPAPTISPTQLLPLVDYLIDTLIKVTPKALDGKLPEGSPELIVKGRSVLESLPDADLCEDSGVEKVKEAMMPHVTDNLMPMKRSFDRNCRVYQKWLTTDEGKTFLSDLNSIVDKILI